MKEFYFEVNCYFEGDKVAAKFFTFKTLADAKAKSQEMFAFGCYALVEISQVSFTDGEDGTTNLDTPVVVESYKA